MRIVPPLGPPASFRRLGSGLERPECVLAHASGLLIASDWQGTGGIALISPSGRVSRIAARGRAEALRPNGITLLPGGRVLLAHLGDTSGGVFALDPDGTVTPVVTEVEGRALPPANFVLADAQGRLWITVSTRRVPRSAAWRADVADGFIVLAAPDAAPRIVADGLGYTNEVALSADGTTLFVVETYARRLAAFDVAADGTLSGKRVVCTFGPGDFPDGIALDAEGAIWVACIIGNRILRVTPDGAIAVMADAADVAHVAAAERAWREGRLTRAIVEAGPDPHFRNISSLAFGGPGLATLFVGSLLGDAILAARSPVPGHPPAHWSVDPGPLPALVEEPAP
jgi:sugar lactone lactonase YvrE